MTPRRDQRGQRGASPAKAGVVAVLAIGLIALVVTLRSAPPSAVAAAPFAGEAEPTRRDARRIGPAIEWPTELRRDPFVRVDEAPTIDAEAIERLARARLRLSSIMRAGHPIAVVNGLVLKRGDTLEGFTLIRIKPRAVVFEKDGVRVELTL